VSAINGEEKKNAEDSYQMTLDVMDILFGRGTVDPAILTALQFANMIQDPVERKRAVALAIQKAKVTEKRKAPDALPERTTEEPISTFGQTPQKSIRLEEPSGLVQIGPTVNSGTGQLIQRAQLPARSTTASSAASVALAEARVEASIIAGQELASRVDALISSAVPTMAKAPTKRIAGEFDATSTTTEKLSDLFGSSTNKPKDRSPVQRGLLSAVAASIPSLSTQDSANSNLRQLDETIAELHEFANRMESKETSREPGMFEEATDSGPSPKKSQKPEAIDLTAEEEGDQSDLLAPPVALADVAASIANGDPLVSKTIVSNKGIAEAVVESNQEINDKIDDTAPVLIKDLARKGRKLTILEQVRVKPIIFVDGVKGRVSENPAEEDVLDKFIYQPDEADTFTDLNENQRQIQDRTVKEENRMLAGMKNAEGRAYPEKVLSAAAMRGKVYEKLARQVEQGDPSADEDLDVNQLILESRRSVGLPPRRKQQASENKARLEFSVSQISGEKASVKRKAREVSETLRAITNVTTNKQPVVVEVPASLRSSSIPTESVVRTVALVEAASDDQVRVASAEGPLRPATAAVRDHVAHAVVPSTVNAHVTVEPSGGVPGRVEAVASLSDPIARTLTTSVVGDPVPEKKMRPTLTPKTTKELSLVSAILDSSAVKDLRLDVGTCLALHLQHSAKDRKARDAVAKIGDIDPRWFDIGSDVFGPPITALPAVVTKMIENGK
jgi:hypothetical protein